jgi:peptidoglycan/LPS O-acetylase OafA/YrhL
MLVIAKCVAGDNAIAATLSWPPLVWLGRISYSFYLLHWMIVVLLARVVAAHATTWAALPSTLLIFVGGFALSAVAATVSWWVAERPYFRRVRPILQSASRT